MIGLAFYKSWFTDKTSVDPNTLMLQYAKAGEHAVLEKLVNDLGDDLYFYLVSLSNEHIAADISQHTWLKVIEKRKQYHAEKSVKAWLFTIARNALIDHYRRTNKSEPLNDKDIDVYFVSNESHNESNCSETQLIHEQHVTTLKSLLARLPFSQREAFIFQQEGFSIDEIAKLTQSNTETVKSRLRYARNFFKQHRGELS